MRNLVSAVLACAFFAEATYAQKASKTFRQGRNRQVGLHSNPSYKLTNSIQITRAAMRTPRSLAEELFDVNISDPVFPDPNQLTDIGTTTMHMLGKQMAEMWADSDKWVDFSYFNPYDVYTLSDNADMPLDSLSSQILGAFGGPDLFPAPWLSKVDPNAVISEGTLLSGDRACLRQTQLSKAIANHPETKALQDRIVNFLEKSGYFPKLRKLLKDPDADANSLIVATETIDKARRQKYDILIDLTADDLRFNDLADAAKTYPLDLASVPEQSYLATWELQQLFIEVSRIVRGDLSLRHAPILNKYWWQAGVHGVKPPKLIMLSADRYIIQGLLGLFNNLYLPKPNAASSIWVDFYECQSQCEWYDQHAVEIVYCPIGRDLKASCTILDYSYEIQDKNGAARAIQFEYWLMQGLARQAYENRFRSLNVDDVCNTQFWPYRPFTSTDYFFEELLDINGFKGKKN